MSERMVQGLSVGGSRVGGRALAARGLASVDMQRLAGDERCALEVEDRADDVAHLADAPQRMETFKAGVGRGVLLGRPDDAERDRVDADATCGVLDGQRTARGDE